MKMPRARQVPNSILDLFTQIDRDVRIGAVGLVRAFHQQSRTAAPRATVLSMLDKVDAILAASSR